MTEERLAARRTLDEYATFGDALENPESRRLLTAAIPDVLDSAMAEQLRSFPLGGFLRFALAPDGERAAALLAALSEIENTVPPRAEPPVIEPDPAYEPTSVARATARLELPSRSEQHQPAEITLLGPSHGNPFVDVDLTAELTLGTHRVRAGGFYDGDGRYRLRFLPPAPGTWRFTTTSTARSLDGITGALEVQPGAGRGPVRVADQFHFASASGTPFLPVGTTAYAWTHQDDERQEETLRTLARAPFNKLRMCLFPKHFLYNSNDPQRFVFPRATGGGWDTERFDVAYFAHLERRIAQLGRLGIEADLILFHPYERWGFADLGKAVDDRYVCYVVRRLAAFPNVWWSMANEYDLITSKRPEDWNRLAGIIGNEDHAGHLISIHNWIELYDHAAPWITHCSLQQGDYDLAGKVDEWRLRWGKPVVIDEFGYDGDLDQGWGNLTSEEVVRRFWAATLRGAYLSHGETFYSHDEVIWWSKGGELKGDSPPRIDFLRRIVAESPTRRIDPLRSDFDAPWGGVHGQYVLIYFGANRPRFRTITVPSSMQVRIDIIDTWNMTIDELPGVHTGAVRVDLPARPYMAVRLRHTGDTT
jgi:Domain of unknown function (DUF5605)/Protein of unknown function (DUF4038)/Domain of unknown function (DUF5060)